MINRLALTSLLLVLACGEEDKGTGPVPESGPDPVAEPDPEGALFAAEVAAVREGCEDDCIVAAATGESDDYGACFVSCAWEGEKALWKVRMLEVAAELQDEGIEVGDSFSDFPDAYLPDIIGSGDTPRTWALRLALRIAAMAGDRESVRSVLEQGADLPGNSEIFFLPGGAPMEFVRIEGGTFLMGSPSSEEGRGIHEGPVHEVEVSTGFWLGKFEVTQGQWEAMTGLRPWTGRNNVVEDPLYPAVYVSWEDVQVLLENLNSAGGEGQYRLPSEAEWEYACRAGTTSPWSFGDDQSRLVDYGWYHANTLDAGEGYAHAVGLKGANPWGLHDMHGNVWEWVQDWFDGGYYEGSPRVDPQGPEAGLSRVIRGGRFDDSPWLLRSANRHNVSPGLRGEGLGLRLLRVR